jgi:hypothetical protein
VSFEGGGCANAGSRRRLDHSLFVAVGIMGHVMVTMSVFLPWPDSNFGFRTWLCKGQLGFCLTTGNG